MDEEPLEEEIQFTLGLYKVLKKIGEGMGEVFLAFDPICGRKIALKLFGYKKETTPRAFERFKKEAFLTCQLSHPSIVPIYAIHFEENRFYYTMPYIEGRSLKDLFIQARQQEEQKTPLDALLSVPSLVSMFRSVCQGIAYAHSQGVLHCDIKPANIIIGKDGKPQISDWGLIELIDKQAEPFLGFEDLMLTPSFVAPELLSGHPHSIQSDIYSLGLIFYEMLTLRFPFHRMTLNAFRHSIQSEVLIDPAQVAPHRPISPHLASIALKCLALDPCERYQTVEELIKDLEKAAEGMPGWLKVAILNVQESKDFEKRPGLLISRASFGREVLLEACVTLGEQGQGIGFLLNVPEKGERRAFFDESCRLWLSSDLQKDTELTCSHAVAQFPTVFLTRGNKYYLQLLRRGSSVYVYINHCLEALIPIYMPSLGTHIGLFFDDEDFVLHAITVSLWGPSLKNDPLSIPDAFLARKHYHSALVEYQRVAKEYSWAEEGTEAMFRAGITLLEEKSFKKALKAFEALEGSPLEYLGQSLVYAALHEEEKEVSSLRAAFQSYRHHPSLAYLCERVIFCLHIPALSAKMVYHYTLIALFYLNWQTLPPATKNRIDDTLMRLDFPLFLDEASLDLTLPDVHICTGAIKLSFWLKTPSILSEIIDDILKMKPEQLALLENAFFALVEMGEGQWVLQKLHKIFETPLDVQARARLEWIREAIRFQQNPHLALSLLDKLPRQLNFASSWPLLFILNAAIDRKESAFVHETIRHLIEHHERYEIEAPLQDQLLALNTWAYLLENDLEEAGALLKKTGSPNPILYGTWVVATEGKKEAQKYFKTLVSPSTSSQLFFSHVLGKPPSAQLLRDASWWDKKQFERHMRLYQITNFDV